MPVPRSISSSASLAGSGAELPPATPAWITPELVALTLRTWQPYYGRTLSAEECIEIIRGVAELTQALGPTRAV